jgi:hypothetical protein
VIRGDRIVVENLTFIGARRPDGREYARARPSQGDRMHLPRQQNGILTGNRGDIELEIENSEFGNNGPVMARATISMRVRSAS